MMSPTTRPRQSANMDFCIASGQPFFRRTKTVSPSRKTRRRNSAMAQTRMNGRVASWLLLLASVWCMVFIVAVTAKKVRNQMNQQENPSKQKILRRDKKYWVYNQPCGLFVYSS